MDRDNRWPRVDRRRTGPIADGVGANFPSATEPRSSRTTTIPTEPNMAGDEFVTPVGGGRRKAGQPRWRRSRPATAVIFYNYRGDRPRELTKAFVQDTVRRLRARPQAKDLYFVTMTAYEAGLPVHVAYPKPPQDEANTLGEYVSASWG